MNASSKLGGLDKAILAWCLFVVVCCVAALVFVLSYRTDPEFLMMAIVQSSLIGAMVTWLYARLARRVFQRSAAANKANRLILFLWAGVTGLLLLFSFLPDPDRDEFASSRYAIGIAIFAFISIAHLVIRRRLRELN